MPLRNVYISVAHLESIVAEQFVTQTKANRRQVGTTNRKNSSNVSIIKSTRTESVLYCYSNNVSLNGMSTLITFPGGGGLVTEDDNRKS